MDTDRDTDRDTTAVSTWQRESGYIGRRTGRRDPPAVCYTCGREIEDATVALYGSFCSGACMEGQVRR